MKKDDMEKVYDIIWNIRLDITYQIIWDNNNEYKNIYNLIIR